MTFNQYSLAQEKIMCRFLYRSIPVVVLSMALTNGLAVAQTDTTTDSARPSSAATDNGDNWQNIGLIGLVGLAGLAGLFKKSDAMGNRATDTSGSHLRTHSGSPV